MGDVGRPGLSPAHTPQQLAAMLYRNIHEKLLTLPDDTEIFPAHGAGSLCGRQMSSEALATSAMSGSRILTPTDNRFRARLVLQSFPILG